METQGIIYEVLDKTMEYKIEEVSSLDVIETRDYLESSVRGNTLSTYEEVIHQNIIDNIQWYNDTEVYAYLDSARELLFSLIEAMNEEGVL